ncbi:hypothetical protein F183_A02490 [Bryobacterales bacterium F-183]|nr:hypothetical protein F183_A02490 [Bryobacterales bacterium F-183]
MRFLSNCLLFAALACPIFGDVIGFYSGDSTSGSTLIENESTALFPQVPTGSSTYQGFVVPTGGWTITRLFTNNIVNYTPTSAYWEIRSGVSENNGGTLLYSGTDSSATTVATGRTILGNPESTVTVSGLSIFLAPGTYWMTVTPRNLSTTARSYQTSTFGANAIGTIPPNESYRNSPAFGQNFVTILASGAFSSGAYIQSASVPEPMELSFLLLGAGGLLGIARRRSNRRS